MSSFTIDYLYQVIPITSQAAELQAQHTCCMNARQELKLISKVEFDGYN